MTSPAVTCAPGETNRREIRPLARGNTASAEADAPPVLPVPEELDTEAAVAPLLVDELGSEISPDAFASTTLPRPPTVTTTSPRLAATVCTVDRAGPALWCLQTMMPTTSATATRSPRSA
jgi:hypothetical protein